MRPWSLVMILTCVIVIPASLFLVQREPTRPAPEPAATLAATVQGAAPRGVPPAHPASRPATRPVTPEAQQEVFLRAYSLPAGRAIMLVNDPISTPYARTSIGYPNATGAVFEVAEDRPAMRNVLVGGPGGYTLTLVLNTILQIDMNKIDGDAILNLRLPGDWVYRKGASEEELLRGISQVYHDVHGVDLSLEYRDVPQDVYIVRGTWNYHPIDSAPAFASKYNDPHPQVHIYAYVTDADRVAPKDRNGASGSLAAALSKRLNAPVTLEVKGLPENITLYQHDERITGRSLRETSDPTLILQHVADQTGFTWTKETRLARKLVARPK